MKVLTYIVIAAFVFACGESSDTKDTKTTESNPIEDTTDEGTVDTTKLDTNNEDNIKDEEVKSTEFEVLEDYARLNSRSAVIDAFPETYKNDTTWVAEGTRMMLTTHITNQENGQQVTYYFDPESDPSIVSSIHARFIRYDKETYEEIGKNQLKSETGIYLGMSLKDLHMLNGAPITFAGFGWDFGGNARANEGKLKGSDVNFMLDMQDYDDSMLGDIMFSSEDETVRNKAIFIESMSIYL